MKYNIVLADDHRLFLEGLVRLIKLEDDLHVLYHAHGGKYVAQYVDSHPEETIHLVITDISMPDFDGIALNNHLKATRPEIRTLVVSMHMDVDMVDALVQHDVDGYLSKNADSAEFLTAIRTILRGEKYFSASVKQAYADSAFSRKKETLELLTEREKSILKLIAEEYTTQEIADKLFLSKHTVESYRKTLFAKLNVRNLAGLTRHAIRLGLVE